jgi:hypothetical protein
LRREAPRDAAPAQERPPRQQPPGRSPCLVHVVSITLVGSLAVEALIDPRDLGHPTPALAMVELQNLFERPVEMKSQEGYLLVQRAEGVA